MYVSIFIILLSFVTSITAQKLTFQGYVEGKFVRVAPTVAGQLEKVLVKEGDSVKEGQEIFRLESKREKASYDKVSANLNRSKEQLENFQKSKRPEEIEAVEAALAQAKATRNHNKIFLNRQKQLVKNHIISDQKLDDAQAAYDQSKARVDELEAQLRLAKLPTAREDEIHAAKADIQANEAALREEQWTLDQKNGHSPVSGRVFEQIYRVGEWVASGSPIITILPPTDTRIRFFVPEPILSQLKTQMIVKIHIDGQEKPLEARITYISPQAQYTPPVIFSREQRAKLVYLIEAQPISTKLSLNPGQPVDVELES